MSIATLPRSIRDQALDTIEKRLGWRPSYQTQLADLGNVVAVEVMLDLEQRFGILIEVDEILPDGTVDTLVGLTLKRTCGRAARAEGFTLIDLAAAKAERARRARAATEPQPPSTTPAAPRPPTEAAGEDPEPVCGPRASPASSFAEAEETASQRMLVFVGLCLLAGAVSAVAFFVLEHLP